VDVFRASCRLSPREILWLCEQLPDDSAVRRDPELQGGHWNLTNLLLSQVLNGVNGLAASYIQAHSKKKVKPPQPVLPPALSQSNMKARKAVYVDDLF